MFCVRLVFTIPTTNDITDITEIVGLTAGFGVAARTCCSSQAAMSSASIVTGVAIGAAGGV